MLPSVCSFGKRNKCSIDFMWVYMSWKPFDYFGEEMDEIKIKSVLAKYTGLLLQHSYLTFIKHVSGIIKYHISHPMENTIGNKKLYAKINK